MRDVDPVALVALAVVGALVLMVVALSVLAP